MSTHDSRLGWWLITAAAVLWGTLGPAFVMLRSFGAEPVHIAFWRALLAGLALFLWLVVQQPSALRIARRDVPFFLAYGLISVAIFFVVYPAAVQASTVAVAAVLLYTAPAWVVALAAIFLREPVTLSKAVAVALTFAGTALVAGAFPPTALRTSGLGIAFGLASGLTYATFGIFGRRALRKYLPTTAMFYALGFGAIFLFPLVLQDWEPFLAPLQRPAGVALLLYTGVLPTAGSFLLYTKGLQRLGDAGRASVIATIEPLVAAVLGFLVLGEGLSFWQMVGGLLVMVGVLALQIRRR